LRGSSSFVHSALGSINGASLGDYPASVGPLCGGPFSFGRTLGALLPLNGRSLPLDWRTLPLYGRSLSLCGRSLPLCGWSLSLYGRSLPLCGRSRLRSSSSFPGHCGHWAKGHLSIFGAVPLLAVGLSHLQGAEPLLSCFRRILHSPSHIGTAG